MHIRQCTYGVYIKSFFVFFLFFFFGGGGVLSIAEGSFLPYNHYNDDLRMTKCNINHINFTNQKHIHCL